MAMEKTAMILAKSLKEVGIDYAFGIPGGEVLEILEAFRKVGIEFILSKHEMGAGFMADAYYQLTGKPGVLISTLGPGLTNTVTPVANAFLDRSAMIVITGEVSTNLTGVYTHQVLEQQDILKPIIKWSTTLVNGSASQAIWKAIEISTSGVPGPVHINVPTNIAGMEQKYVSIKRKVAFPVDPSREAVDAFMNCLVEAKRPVLLAGVNIRKEEASSIREFCEKWRIPVITTYKAKGVIPEYDAISFGGTGLSPSVDNQHFQLLREHADLILTVGFDPIELRSDWNLSWETKTINVDTIPNQYQLIPVDMEYVGEIGRFFIKLNEAQQTVQSKWSDEELFAYKDAIKDRVKPKEAVGLSPYDVVSETRKLMPEDAIAIVDTGSHRIMLNHVWECYHPKELLQSNGLGTMAYALPAAIGAQLTHPDRQVVAFMGDAGLDMITGELALLNQYQLPVTLVVFRDNMLSLIRLKQQRMGYESTGVEFIAPAYDQLAKAYGGIGVVVENVNELREAVKISQQSERFTLIEARINPSEYHDQM
ncbi:thiamine pyrophosphate-binding protein [Bacillus sp. JJ1532]|uniref:thiamine pyrophosphate-binding protein n=1 Tax=Bacillus sp. JJ1532 TaxID=3122958 RepID=UPI003000363B